MAVFINFPNPRKMLRQTMGRRKGETEGDKVKETDVQRGGGGERSVVFSYAASNNEIL